MGGTIAAYVVIALLCGAACHALAIRKGKNPAAFFALGFILGIIGILIAIFIPGEPETPPGMAAVSCPRCNAKQNIHLNDLHASCWQCQTPFYRSGYRPNT